MKNQSSHEYRISGSIPVLDSCGIEEEEKEQRIHIG